MSFNQGPTFINAVYTAIDRLGLELLHKQLDLWNLLIINVGARHIFKGCGEFISYILVC